MHGCVPRIRRVMVSPSLNPAVEFADDDKVKQGIVGTRWLPQCDEGLRAGTCNGL